MAVLIACLFMGFVLVAGCNIIEIRHTLSDRHVRPYVGTACYLACTSLGYGAIFWLVAIALVELANLISR